MKKSYTKNQKTHLKQAHGDIFLKIAVAVVPIIILTVVLWGVFSINPPPEKWESEQVTFLSVSRERVIKNASYLFNTADGDYYILPVGSERAEQLSRQLVPYEQYEIVCCENAFAKIAKSLRSDENVFIDLESSVAEWKFERQILYAVVAVMLSLAVAGGLLSYLFWCKKERGQIALIKAKFADSFNRDV